MNDRLVIQGLDDLVPRCGTHKPVDWDHGALALDALQLATSEDLLAALLDALVEADAAKKIVELLLKHELLFDEIVEWQLRSGETGE